ncbi:hypothetical protein [Leisingera sp. ANG-M7]|uniref:hypothetical protein n=1 Tax=Leisingera sp. ANG-M7 TaxID=1577902 RepID=UPI00068D105B|nr:hypothetical protein [Leisingera sp. ANG-M7]
MTSIFDQIKADREVGTKGDFGTVTDHEWSLDTEGENSYYVIGPNNRPLAVVAVEQAFGMDRVNEADMRRFCRLPQLERIALAAEGNDIAFMEIKDAALRVIQEIHIGPDGEGEDLIQTLEAICEDCDTQTEAHREARK